MFLGRLFGWGLLGLALLMASGDVVLALGPGDHAGLLTRDVWVLLAGHAPQADAPPSSFGHLLMACPAWAAVAPLGGILLWACRSRRRRHRFHQTFYS
ncbi:hypothetical protein [Telmatospirillum siberiense]|uniref:Uncharacterized protein n=1 Tax=Telmatospirillum siberiense TaxID=382514 RepID=A0A2N3PQQ9_9PROT|nr:hypothetical protein [Telmatospirillum siberiense]PKU22736.1 hypothetical protein CWS72_19865 [Telmatospirillum siberiense]